MIAIPATTWVAAFVTKPCEAIGYLTYEYLSLRSTSLTSLISRRQAEKLTASDLRITKKSGSEKLYEESNPTLVNLN